jgi:hypothetical protein
VDKPLDIHTEPLAVVVFRSIAVALVDEYRSVAGYMSPAEFAFLGWQTASPGYSYFCSLSLLHSAMLFSCPYEVRTARGRVARMNLREATEAIGVLLQGKNALIAFVASFIMNEHVTALLR